MAAHGTLSIDPTAPISWNVLLRSTSRYTIISSTPSCPAPGSRRLEAAILGANCLSFSLVSQQTVPCCLYPKQYGTGNGGSSHERSSTLYRVNKATTPPAAVLFSAWVRSWVRTGACVDTVPGETVDHTAIDPSHAVLVLALAHGKRTVLRPYNCASFNFQLSVAFGCQAGAHDARTPVEAQGVYRGSGGEGDGGARLAAGVALTMRDPAPPPTLGYFMGEITALLVSRVHETLNTRGAIENLHLVKSAQKTSMYADWTR